MKTGYGGKCEYKRVWKSNRGECADMTDKNAFAKSLFILYYIEH